MKYTFRQAKISEAAIIWRILEEAIQRRKEEGSNQWQDGYPNLSVVNDDIRKGVGYVLTDGNVVVGYCAVLINDEPAYADLAGQWLTNSNFVVFHRVAISEAYLGIGLAGRMLQYVEEYALEHHIYSIKADTNFDNMGMLRVFEKLGYVYCGEVTLRGASRKAFEKVLK